jgi:hypothetical protein
MIAPEQLEFGFDEESASPSLSDVKVNTLARYAADLAPATEEVGEREEYLVAVIEAVRP